MTKKIMLMLSMIILLAFAAAACTPSKKPMPPEPARRPAPQAPAPTTPAPKTTPAAPAPKALHQRSAKIADEVDKINGIKRSHVVLSDNTSYIGLDLDRNIEGSKVDNIKKEAEKRAKSVDKSLTNIIVTTDVDAVTRIKKVAQGVKEGKPLTSFTKELEEIGRRLKPATGR